MAADNSGVNGINADGCAGCHRAHTAQGMYLLVADSETGLCLSCHGGTGLGATTDVENGVQYTLGTNPLRETTVLGYLRSGGFVNARIGSGQAVRVAYLSGTAVRQTAKVPVRTAGSQPVTSAHLPNVGGVVGAAEGVSWGNGPDSATAYAGPEVEIECATCHNPHGNGQYRILNPIPEAPALGADPFVPATTAATVTDAALPPAGDTRNYTIIQTFGGTGTLLASQVETAGYASTAGDYFRRRVPWNATATGTSANDAPNAQPTTFYGQISTWCLTCHSRYLSSGWDVKTTDAIYTYRHSSTASSRNCITCHVAHGSNAQMTGEYSKFMEYPGGAVAPAGDSRLLKADNRGTCQLCHEPTGTITAGTQVGPTPVPVTP